MKDNSKEHAEILKKIDEICIKLNTQFVTQDQFGPVRAIVYGLVGIVLTGTILLLGELITQRKIL